MTTRSLQLPHGITIEVAQPYAEGHVLSFAEADKLNKTFADSIRSSLMNRLKNVETIDAQKAVALQAEYQQFAHSYSFSVRSTRPTLDPVTKEAHKIAKEQIFAAIRNKGGDPRNYSAEQIAEYIAKVLQKKPEILEEAERRIASTKEFAAGMLHDLED